MGTQTLEALRDVLSGADVSVQGTDTESQLAFRRIAHAIVSLEYEPAAMVSERELMEKTGASRVALRFAVTRLSDLGLITPMARKGLMIPPSDILDVPTVYDARLAIESSLARLAATRATPEQIANLKALADEDLHNADDGPTFVSRDLALHLGIAASARNMYLEDALTRILPLSARLWHRLYREVGSDQRFMFHHDEIISGIAAHDPAKAEAAIREHLQSARETLTLKFMPIGRTESP